MQTVPSASGVAIGRAACLGALLPLVTICLLVIQAESESPAGWFLGGVVASAASVGAAAVLLPRGDGLVFAMLWFGLGMSLGVSVAGALSGAPLFLFADVMMVWAIATAPNRTGRSRAHWSRIAVLAFAFSVAIALPLVPG